MTMHIIDSKLNKEIEVAQTGLNQESDVRER